QKTPSETTSSSVYGRGDGSASPAQNEDEVASLAFDIPSSDRNGEEPATSAFPQDNPWLTVTEEESGTRPPLLSRLWQSHVHVRATETSPSEKPATPEIPNSEAVELPLTERSTSIDESTSAPEFRLPPPPLRRVPETPQPATAPNDLAEGAAINPTQSRRLP